MLPLYSANRTKATHKPTRRAARRLRDIEFDEAENKENANVVATVFKQTHAEERDRQYRLIYSAKRTKRLIPHSAIARRLVFSMYDRSDVDNLDYCHMCKVPRTSWLEEDVFGAQKALLVLPSSLYFDERNVVCLGDTGDQQQQQQRSTLTDDTHAALPQLMNDLNLNPEGRSCPTDKICLPSHGPQSQR